MTTVSGLILLDAPLEEIEQRALSHREEALTPFNGLNEWPMRDAILKKRYDVMELLYSINKSTVSTQRWYNSNLLDLAVSLEDTRAIRLLYKMNRHLFSQPNAIGHVPLDTALYHGKVASVYTIVQLNKRFLNARSKCNQLTPVEVAALMERTDMVELLIGLGSTTWQSTLPRLCSTSQIVLQHHVAQIFHAIGFPVSRTPVSLSVEEEENIRYRIYFATSLIDRLFFHLE